MADKKITDLQLISEVTAGLSVPSDDGIQSYRFTAAKMKSFILANQNILLAMLKNDIFSGLSAVTPADDDHLVLTDASDSNNTKKAPISAFARNAYRSITSTDSLGASDGTAKLSGASFTLTLPTAVGIAGRRYKIIHTGTNFTQVYTLATTSGQTIGGIASGSYALYTNGEVLEIESDGANWIILNHLAVTDWISYTLVSGTDVKGTTTDPTFATSTLVKKGYYRRVGRNLQWRFEYKNTNGTGAGAGSGEYKFLVPAGLSIDTALVTAYNTVPHTFTTGPLSHVGSGMLSQTSSFLFASVIVFDANFVRLMGMDAANYYTAGSAGYTMSQANAGYFFQAEFPISGWQP